MFHKNPQHLNLHAWFLGADSSKKKTGGLSGAVVIYLPYTSDVCGSNLGPQVGKLVDGNHLEPI